MSRLRMVLAAALGLALAADLEAAKPRLPRSARSAAKKHVAHHTMAGTVTAVSAHSISISTTAHPGSAGKAAKKRGAKKNAGSHGHSVTLAILPGTAIAMQSRSGSHATSWKSIHTGEHVLVTTA